MNTDVPGARIGQQRVGHTAARCLHATSIDSTVALCEELSNSQPASNDSRTGPGIPKRRTSIPIPGQRWPCVHLLAERGDGGPVSDPQDQRPPSRKRSLRMGARSRSARRTTSPVISAAHRASRDRSDALGPTRLTSTRLRSGVPTFQGTSAAAKADPGRSRACAVLSPQRPYLQGLGPEVRRTWKPW